MATFGLFGVRHRHALLEIDRTLYGVDGAAQLYKYAVSGPLENAAMMFGDQGLHNFAAPRLEPDQRAGLVDSHQPTIADHVSRKNGCEAALSGFFGHKVRLRQTHSQGIV